MHSRFAALAAFATLVVVSKVARAEGEDDDHPSSTAFQLAANVGYIPANVHGTAVAVNATGPLGGGEDTAIPMSGFTLGAQATMLFPYYGPGLPRAMLLAGFSGFFGHNSTSTFADVHPGGGNDTGVTLKRPFAIDLAIGGTFPLCRRPTCLDLRVFLGGSLVRQTLTGFTDETGDGGVREESTAGRIKTAALFGVLVTDPLCSKCSSSSLRLQVGAIARSFGSSSVDFTSATGKTYVMSIDTGVELNFVLGLLLPV